MFTTVHGRFEIKILDCRKTEDATEDMIFSASSENNKPKNIYFSFQVIYFNMHTKSWSYPTLISRDDPVSWSK